ncbi:hypothetical protein O181_064013 [Austropuccinia psidii MF-1]|uniref:Uncharacterized protein n=1 Tax=Austropuccinia psidii MF-1 TaxID=1389203 RepID=A0A9Q3EMA3_9BASI|nr:hypothetical protein [Austropuccinia psidii MF-1]
MLGAGSQQSQDRHPISDMLSGDGIACSFNIQQLKSLQRMLPENHSEFGILTGVVDENFSVLLVNRKFCIAEASNMLTGIFKGGDRQPRQPYDSGNERKPKTPEVELL